MMGRMIVGPGSKISKLFDMMMRKAAVSTLSAAGRLKQWLQTFLLREAKTMDPNIVAIQAHWLFLRRG